jgi:hypothetical protein
MCHESCARPALCRNRQLARLRTRFFAIRTFLLDSAPCQLNRRPPRIFFDAPLRPAKAMASSSRRGSQAPAVSVNLHCTQCDNQVGIFENEFTRLTASYVRAVHPGAHFGTDVNLNKAQTVPEGTTQAALQGCVLAEVTCNTCAATVGQYIKDVPSQEQMQLL